MVFAALREPSGSGGCWRSPRSSASPISSIDGRRNFPEARSSASLSRPPWDAPPRRAWPPCRRLLRLEEPLSALDGPTREELRVELRRVLEEQRIPAVVVTHDRVEALALGDRIAVLASGAIRQSGAVEEVFTSPA